MKLQLSFVLCKLLLVLVSSQPTTDYDRGPLQELTQFRQQHRFTVSGQLCAAAFVQNYQTYTDCTDAPNPEGSSGREWCYLEVQLLGKGARNWGYCSPVIDYNLVRAKANEAFQAKANEVEKMVERLDTERNRLEDILRRYNSTCGAQHDAVGARLGKIETLVAKADHCVTKIEETTAKISSIKETIVNVQEQIEIQKEAALKAPENCATVSGYEDDPFPDGVRGSYYKNPFFRGLPLYRNDEQINFQWTAKDPMPGIPNQGFAVRWDGYIRAPFTAEYTFILEADCGARMFLNGQPVIADRMPPPSSKDALSEGEVLLLPPSDHDGPKRVESAPVVLNGGEKNRIRVEMIHSNHLRWSNPDDASIKLMWRSAGQKAETIPKNYFYQSNSKAPLKISGLDPSTYEITFLYDGEYAHKAFDLTLALSGSKTIRTVEQPTDPKLSFDVNIPATLFLAAPVGVANPFSPCEGAFKDTGDILSIYEAESRSARATTATHLTIYKTDIFKPKLFTVNILKAKTPFIAFLMPRKDAGGACGGSPTVLSRPDSAAYESCEASSTKAPEFGCQYGLNGRNVDQPNAAWKSKGGNGVGEYIIVRFKVPIQITEFKVKPLDDPVTWPAEITLSFSEESEEGNQQVFTILHSNNMDHLAYPVAPQITKYIKILVTKMYVNGEDTGGSFELLGTICREEEMSTTTTAAPGTVQPTGPPPPSELITIEDCSQTVDDLSQAHPMETGKKLPIACPTQCLKPKSSGTSSSSFILSKVSVAKGGLEARDVTEPEWRVFGSDEYSPESEICSAAIHAGVCTSPSDFPCHLTVEMLGGKPEFKGELKHGIKSEAHGPSEIAIVFTAAAAAPPQEEPMGIEYGISFRAVDVGPPPQGYRIDDGGVSGQKDPSTSLIYGWELPAKLVKCPARGGDSSNPLNEGGVEFPPPPSSPICESGEMDCRPNSWSINLPANGPYRIEVQVGSPCEPKEGDKPLKIGFCPLQDNVFAGTRKYFLQANGQNIINGEDLSKGKFFWATEDISVTNKILTLTADCKAGEVAPESVCKTAITTLMNIKIIQVDTKKVKTKLTK